MDNRVVAEVFPPGVFIKEELEERGWTQADLSEILDVYPSMVNDIITGKRSISPEIANGLGLAFGTGAQFWLNLDSAYQLSKAKPSDESIARRARLYELFPVRDLIRRHWVEHSDNIEVLEKRFCDFFGINECEETPKICHAARKTAASVGRYDETNMAQAAWLCRARHLAPAVHVNAKFSDANLGRALAELRNLLPNPEDVRQVPRILSKAGIRLLIIEPIANTRIDGAALWLNASSPVVALSFRYDRIDWFWFTLMHEVDHVKNREGIDFPVVDNDLVGEHIASKEEDKPANEKRADRFASDFLVPRGEMDKFIARIKPLYSKTRIRLFSQRLQVHPGVVVGQLQRRGEIEYRHNREMLEKVRSIITSSALTDGYGNTPML
ncbi:MAG TPA: HigA family addiction module antitoxin [Blastocatellia bacterium]|nr:HigA family addiction module antitoxin [Blastocatellia bacterium]